MQVVHGYAPQPQNAFPQASPPQFQLFDNQKKTKKYGKCLLYSGYFLLGYAIFGFLQNLFVILTFSSWTRIVFPIDTYNSITIEYDETTFGFLIFMDLIRFGICL